MGRCSRGRCPGRCRPPFVAVTPGTSIRAAGAPSPALTALLASLWTHRHLLAKLVLRDLASRYRGSFIGLLWSLVLPCAMLGIYLFVFGHVFTPVRAVGQEGVNAGFALSLFSGLLVHGLLAESITRSPMAVLTQPSYVKKVVFPLELLPFTTVGSALVQFLIGSMVLIAALAVWQGIPSTALLWPLAWLPLVALAAGVALILSALTVYLRDLAQLTGFVATVLLFLSPVFYPLASAPAAIQGWLMLNPLTVPLEGARDLLIHGRVPSLLPWAIHAAGCLLALWAGWWVFQRTRRGFADVI